jgi:hypothetical protein
LLDGERWLSFNNSTVVVGEVSDCLDDGIWLVSFMDYGLGYIELEQWTLQPLDNPSAPRLGYRSAVLVATHVALGGRSIKRAYPQRTKSVDIAAALQTVTFSEDRGSR